ncbi:MAG: M15 family metallopeptidase, partial [Acidimicrobiia bacterium]|nr:M15 family metallopeptidase [Acidimicrobiia bacterium]
GNYYAIKPSQTFGYSARTIAGSYRVSLHGHGAAIDINALTNPYRGDNKLITDMPEWFVAAWTDAGFCWGGDWMFIKDPQHFSWMGPAATQAYGPTPLAYPVDTSPAAFADEVLVTQTPFGQPNPDYQYVIADGDGNGLADVFQLVPRSNGTRLEYSQTDRRHEWCAVGRDHALDIEVGDRIALMGDYSRVGRNDLLLIDNSDEYLSIQVSLKPTSFEESITVPTLIPSVVGDDYLFGDHDRDGNIDLYVIHHGESATSVTVYDGGEDFTTQLLATDTGLGDTTGSLFTLGDTNLDELPDLFAVTRDGDTKTVAILPNGYSTVTATYSLDVEGELIDVRVNDYDGDGRGDLWLWDTSGTLRVRLGNIRLPGVSPSSWHNNPGWECDEDSPPYVFSGLFRDDDGNIHEQDIDTIGAAGISQGCNPPFNDEYCPDREVSRGEIAAFLVRTFGLTDDGGEDWFVDDDESVFQSDINKLAAAGITTGCNSPDLDEFCPDETVSRAAMAAFLVRALGLEDNGGGDLFVDDDGSVFEADIDKLAIAGITLGCNPPVYDRFCPTEPVRRDQMASFLARALGSLTA